MPNYNEFKIFSGIDETTINTIINNWKKEEYIAGQIILAEWDDSNGKWYIIEEWDVSVEMKGKEIANLGTWEMFWEIALLNEEKRNATIKAKTNVSLIVLSLEDLIEMINNDENKINKEILRRMEENMKMEN